jgi:hypothetical protein
VEVADTSVLVGLVLLELVQLLVMVVLEALAAAVAAVQHQVVLEALAVSERY